MDHGRATHRLVTRSRLTSDLPRLGLSAGDTVMLNAGDLAAFAARWMDANPERKRLRNLARRRAAILCLLPRSAGYKKCFCQKEEFRVTVQA